MNILDTIYNRLKNRYDLTYTTTKALQAGFTIDVPVIFGQRGTDSFYLYLEGKSEEDLVFSVTYVDLYAKDGKEQIHHTHNHPWRVATAIYEIEKFMNSPYIFTVAHYFCTNNRPLLKKSQQCGCFYCLSIYSPDEIAGWIPDNYGTAKCPHCGIDAVLPESEEYTITKQFLRDMRNVWFENNIKT